MTPGWWLVPGDCKTSNGCFTISALANLQVENLFEELATGGEETICPEKDKLVSHNSVMVLFVFFTSWLRSLFILRRRWIFCINRIHANFNKYFGFWIQVELLFNKKEYIISYYHDEVLSNIEPKLITFVLWMTKMWIYLYTLKIKIYIFFFIYENDDFMLIY